MYAYAVGQAVDTQSLDVAQAKVNAMEGSLNAIEPNVAFGKTSYTNEVAAYQRTGQTGVSSIAPTIEAVGVPATKPLTQAAWQLNGRLHTDISSWGPLGPGYTDAINARDLAWKMLASYKQAILVARQAASQAPVVSRTSTVAAPLQSAAQALLAAIRATSAAGQPVMWTSAHGQATAMWRPTWVFQQAQGHLKLDGIYGAQTEKALQAVVGPAAVATAHGRAPATATAAPAAVSGRYQTAGDPNSKTPMGVYFLVGALAGYVAGKVLVIRGSRRS
jgi:hypothetical protein